MLYLAKSFRREEGIRTLDTLLRYTHFPGVRLRPLGHLSKIYTFALIKKGGEITKKKVIVKILHVNFV